MANEKLYKTLYGLEQEALIELWDIDLRPLGGDLLRFSNFVNEKEQPVTWKGVEYTAYPIQGEGFEMKSDGSPSRPKLSVSNMMGLVTAAIDRFDGMLGARVTRRLTVKQFLDAVNFEGGNPTADPTQEVTQTFEIERVSSWNRDVGVFELAAPSEADGATIPCRLMLPNTCRWQYRGEGCGYNGPPVADEFGQPTDDPKKDKCPGRLTDCQIRWGKTAVLPFGGFPGCDKVR